MAIDAVIERVRRRDWAGDGSLRLTLAPRVDRNGADTCPGRSVLNVLGPRTVEPEVGMCLWGGADVVSLVVSAERQVEYQRKGTFLRESRACERCSARLKWSDITDELTGARRDVMRCPRCGGCFVDEEEHERTP